MSRRARLLTVLVGLLVVSAPIGGVATTVLAASNPTISIDAPDTLTAGSTSTATLVATQVGSGDDIGAYELNISYDPSAISLSVENTAAFSVETSAPESGILQVVGYTDQLETANGSLSLAEVSVTGERETGSSTLDVAVESVADTDGNELPVSTQSTSITIEAPATATPTPTPSDDTGGQQGQQGGQAGPVDTATPQPGPAAAVSVNISDAAPDRAGTTVQFQNVSVSEITFTDEGIEGTASVRDLGTDLPDDVRSAAGSEDVVHAVEITVPETARNRSATIRLSVPRDALNGVAPENARVARFADGEWQLLETRVIATNGPIVLEADTPGFSVFGVMASQETATATATETGDTATETAAVTDTRAATVSERQPTDTASATPATESAVPTASPTEAGMDVTDTDTSTEEPAGGFPWGLIGGVILVLVVALIAVRFVRQ